MSSSAPTSARSMFGSIYDIEQDMAHVLEQNRRGRGLARACVQCAMQRIQSLQGCRLEVVGSTSWGGDVPESDYDLILLTRHQNLAPEEKATILEQLLKSLDLRCHGLTKITATVVNSARVQVLRVHTDLLSFDVSVDLHHSCKHRDFLLAALRELPQARKLIRIVKGWIRRRGLPCAAEGGPTMIAWAVAALRFAEVQSDQPALEQLVMRFFAYMNSLLCNSLHVLQYKEDHCGWFVWQPRGMQMAWADEFAELLQVEDPIWSNAGGSGREKGQLHNLSGPGPSPHLTKGRIPTAVALLYVGELSLAWKALRDQCWDKFWAPVDPAMQGPLSASRPSPSSASATTTSLALHLFLRCGEVFVGQIHDIRQAGERRVDRWVCDRNKVELRIRPLTLTHFQENVGLAVVQDPQQNFVSCTPCQWMCSLTAGGGDGGTARLLGDSLMRFQAVKEIVDQMRMGAFQPLGAKATVPWCGLQAIGVSGFKDEAAFADSQAQQGIEPITPECSVSVTTASDSAGEQTACWQMDAPLVVQRLNAKKIKNAPLVRAKACLSQAFVGISHTPSGCGRVAGAAAGGVTTSASLMTSAGQEGWSQKVINAPDSKLLRKTKKDGCAWICPVSGLQGSLCACCNSGSGHGRGGGQDSSSRAAALQPARAENKSRRLRNAPLLRTIRGSAEGLLDRRASKAPRESPFDRGGTALLSGGSAERDCTHRVTS